MKIMTLYSVRNWADLLTHGICGVLFTVFVNWLKSVVFTHIAYVIHLPRGVPRIP